MTDLGRKLHSRTVVIITVVSIIAGLALVIFFGGRAVLHYVRLQQHELVPRSTDVEAIRSWMTVPYIAKSYHVPEKPLFDELGIPPPGNEKLSLRQLADKYGQDVDVLLHTVQQVVLRHLPKPPPTAEGTVP